MGASPHAGQSTHRNRHACSHGALNMNPCGPQLSSLEHQGVRSNSIDPYGHYIVSNCTLSSFNPRDCGRSPAHNTVASSHTPVVLKSGPAASLPFSQHSRLSPHPCCARGHTSASHPVVAESHAALQFGGRVPPTFTPRGSARRSDCRQGSPATIAHRNPLEFTCRNGITLNTNPRRFSGLLTSTSVESTYSMRSCRRSATQTHSHGAVSPRDCLQTEAQ